MNQRTQHGFSLVEMAIVMVIIGLLIGLTMPLFRTAVKQNKLVEDRTLLKEAKSALVGELILKGALPDPQAGDTLPAGTLGVAAANPYSKPLYYDVAPELTVSGSGGNLTNLCGSLPTVLNASDAPRIWSGGDYSDPALSSPVAFVIISSGADYRLNGQNTPMGSSGDRIYENPSKLQDDNYDDLVASYPLTQLCSLCQDQGYSCGTANSGNSNPNHCGAVAGERCLTLTNSTSGTLYWDIGSDPRHGNTCQSLAAGATLQNGPYDEEFKLLVSTTIDGTTCEHRDRLMEEKLKNIDTNDDQLAEVNCPATTFNSCTEQ